MNARNRKSILSLSHHAQSPHSSTATHLRQQRSGHRLNGKTQMAEEDARSQPSDAPPTASETVLPQPASDPSLMCPDRSLASPERDRSEWISSPFNKADILRALEVVDRDSVAISESFTSLFASLRLALSEASSTSVDHMQCFNDAAGCLQVSALDAASRGNRYINSCFRLNEEMKGIDSLAKQLKTLRRNVDALDSTVNRLVRFP